MLSGAVPAQQGQEASVLIAWREGPLRTAASERLHHQGFRRLRAPIVPQAPETWAVPPSLTPPRAVAQLRRDPAVRVVEINQRRALAELIPNDPLFVTSSWPLRNPGGLIYPPGTANPPGTADADIDATDAWERTTGSRDTIVAVLDTGMVLAHPDLVVNLWRNAGEIAGNGVDDDLNGYVDDIHGFDFASGDATPEDISGIAHGTFVSGIIGMAGDNGTGAAGVCWEVSLMPVRVFGTGLLSDIIAGIDYARMNGASVINASYGGFGFSALEREAIERAAEAEIVFVAASGNDGVNTDLHLFYPACLDLPNLLAVGASNPNDAIPGFSNWGWNTVDLFAPGFPIFSTTHLNAGSPPGYRWNGGTSFAAPHASGAAALLRSLHPMMPAREIVERLRAGADRPPRLAETARTGGRLNAAGVWSEDAVAPAAVTDLHTLDVASLGARLAFTAVGDDGVAGQAARWDVRFSTTPITPATWDDALRAWDVPTPGLPGEPVWVPLSRWSGGTLAPSTSYHAAVRAVDEAGQLGPLSNACTFITPGVTTLFFDDFETDSGAWTLDAPWQRTAETETASGAYCLHDSVDPGAYAPGIDTAATLAPLDLTGHTGAELQFATQWNLQPGLTELLDAGVVEVSTDGLTWERALVFHTTSTPYRMHRLPLGRWDGEATVHLRWRLFADANPSTTGQGWWIDDVHVFVPHAPLRSTPDVIVESEGVGLSPPLLDSYTEAGDAGTPWFSVIAKSAFPVLDASRVRANAISPERGARAVFRPWIPVAGLYDVAVTWPAAANAAAVTFTVTHASGSTETVVDQDDATANAWISLGVHRFAVGDAGSVTLDESSVTGPVDGDRAGRIVADAVRWRLVAAMDPASTEQSGVIWR